MNTTKGERITLYRAPGCPLCDNTGYQGRSGIFEFIGMDERMRNYIHANAGEQEMEAWVRKSTPGILEAGFKMVPAGDTSLEEVLRVAGA